MSNEDTAVCPVCGTFLKPRDSRKRIFKQYNGTKSYIRIRRLKCFSCGKIHNELPDILIPYKHYGAEVIEDVLAGVLTPDDPVEEDCPSEETMKRWRFWFHKKMQPITGSSLLHNLDTLETGWLKDAFWEMNYPDCFSP